MSRGPGGIMRGVNIYLDESFHSAPLDERSTPARDLVRPRPQDEAAPGLADLRGRGAVSLLVGQERGHRGAHHARGRLGGRAETALAAAHLVEPAAGRRVRGDAEGRARPHAVAVAHAPEPLALVRA